MGAKAARPAHPRVQAVRVLLLNPHSGRAAIFGAHMQYMLRSRKCRHMIQPVKEV